MGEQRAGLPVDVIDGDDGPLGDADAEDFTHGALDFI